MIFFSWFSQQNFFLVDFKFKLYMFLFFSIYSIWLAICLGFLEDNTSPILLFITKLDISGKSLAKIGISACR